MAFDFTLKDIMHKIAIKLGLMDATKQEQQPVWVCYMPAGMVHECLKGVMCHKI